MKGVAHNDAFRAAVFKAIRLAVVLVTPDGALSHSIFSNLILSLVSDLIHELEEAANVTPDVNDDDAKVAGSMNALSHLLRPTGLSNHSNGTDRLRVSRSTSASCSTGPRPSSSLGALIRRPHSLSPLQIHKSNTKLAKSNKVCWLLLLLYVDIPTNRNFVFHTQRHWSRFSSVGENTFAPLRSLSFDDSEKRTPFPLSPRKVISDPLIVCYRELYGTDAKEIHPRSSLVNTKKSLEQQLSQYFQAFTIAPISRLKESMNPRFFARLRQRQEANVSTVIQERLTICSSEDVIQTHFIIF